MNASTLDSRLPALATGLLLLALAVTLLPTPALAQTAEPRPSSLAVSAPREAPLGETASILAVLKDSAGQPIQGARILFTSPARFAGTAGEMAIEEVLTDAQGTAKLDYQLTIQGPNRFIARFYGDGLNQPAEASADISATGLVQITRRTAGIQVPVLGWWIIVLVLWSVWAVYFIGMLQILSIVRSGSQHPSSGSQGGTRWETGGQP